MAWALVLGACGDDAPREGDGSLDSTSGPQTSDDTTQGRTTGMSTDGSDTHESATSTTGTDDTTSDPSDSTGDTADEDSGSDDDTGDDTGDDTDDDTGDDTGNPGNDQDGDGIPDDADPFPNDPDLPGTVDLNRIYAHSSSVLWTMEVDEPYALQQVGSFSYQSHAGSMTDIAIDMWGVLYGVTFGDLFVCHPQQAMCYRLAGLPQSFNGLTVIPSGFIEPNKEVLVAIANNGTWHRVDLVGQQQAQLMQIGSYGGGYTSSGDAFSILGVGTYGAVNGSPFDIIVEVNPSNGNVLSEIATVDGYSSIYGLAGWAGAIFAFDESSAVLRIDPVNGDVQTIHANTSASWWGAGVGTILPQ